MKLHILRDLQVKNIRKRICLCFAFCVLILSSAKSQIRAQNEFPNLKILGDCIVATNWLAIMAATQGDYATEQKNIKIFDALNWQFTIKLASMFDFPVDLDRGDINEVKKRAMISMENLKFMPDNGVRTKYARDILRQNKCEDLISKKQ
jgi:hypothetical protein